jgi:hypothetical protein
MLYGTPLVSGELGFTAVVTDSVGGAGRRDLSISITGLGTYVPGDVNNNGQTNGIDVVYFVTYLKGGPLPPFTMNCPPHGVLYAACDANGSCTSNGIDVTYMVAFFKGLQPTLGFCPDCPPGPVPSAEAPDVNRLQVK